MSKRMELPDPAFDESLTVRQAYLAMFQFLEAYHRRGETTTGDLISSIQIGLWQDKGSADPAQLNDFLHAVRVVRESKVP